MLNEIQLNFTFGVFMWSITAKADKYFWPLPFLCAQLSCVKRVKIDAVCGAGSDQGELITLFCSVFCGLAFEWCVEFFRHKMHDTRRLSLSIQLPQLLISLNGRWNNLIEYLWGFSVWKCLLSAEQIRCANVWKELWHGHSPKTSAHGMFWHFV